MKKLVIFTCFIIPHLLIGQSKSLVITNKKNGKELIIKIGEIIKVKGGNSIYKERGEFTAFSDSILNNYPFSLETVNSIYYKNKTNETSWVCSYWSWCVFFRNWIGIGYHTSSWVF